MAWASVGLLGNQGSTGSTTVTITTTIAASANNIVVVTAAMRNPTTPDGADTTVLTGLSDSAGNEWIKAREIQASPGVVNSGAVCSIWYSHLTNALSSGGTITANFGTIPGTTANAIGAWAFSIGGSASVRVRDTTFLTATSAQDPGLIDLAINTATEILRFRGIASESSLTTALTTTAGWSNIGTTRASATGPMSYRGEFIISSATTAASNPTFTSTATDSSVYVMFEECNLMGTASL